MSSVRPLRPTIRKSERGHCPSLGHLVSWDASRDKRDCFDVWVEEHDSRGRLKSVSRHGGKKNSGVPLQTQLFESPHAAVADGVITRFDAVLGDAVVPLAQRHPQLTPR